MERSSGLSRRFHLSEQTSFIDMFESASIPSEGALAEEFIRQQRRQHAPVWLRVAAACWWRFHGAGHLAGFLSVDRLSVTAIRRSVFSLSHHCIPKVRRADYLVFDREDLPYLNLMEKFNCFYCSYGNGVAALYALKSRRGPKQYRA